MVTIRGEGVFHRLSLDLPRIVPSNNEKLMSLLMEAREIVEKEKETPRTSRSHKLLPVVPAGPVPRQSSHKLDGFMSSISSGDFEEAQVSLQTLLASPKINLSMQLKL